VSANASSWLHGPEAADVPREVQDLWREPLERLGFVPNVLRNYALRPSHLLLWNAHYEEVMRGDSGLSRPEREMIAVVVSVANDCRYCIAAHTAALRKLTGDPGLADAVAFDRRTPPIEPRTVAILDFAHKLTRSPSEMAEEDVHELRRVGLTDEDIMDVAEVTGMFNLTNRMASGLGWVPNPEYETLGR
jgi:uncharacterized peroxidase-related enzyme